MIAVKSAPVKTPRIGLLNIVKIFLNSGISANGFTASLIVSIPNIKIAKPNKMLPISFFFWLFAKLNKIMPINARTGEKEVGLKIFTIKLSPSKPDKLRIQEVAVVPRFAPMIMPIA